MFDLQPPRHISTLRLPADRGRIVIRQELPLCRHSSRAPRSALAGGKPTLPHGARHGGQRADYDRSRDDEGSPPSGPYPNLVDWAVPDPATMVYHAQVVRLPLQTPEVRSSDFNSKPTARIDQVKPDVRDHNAPTSGELGRGIAQNRHFLFLLISRGGQGHKRFFSSYMPWLGTPN